MFVTYVFDVLFNIIFSYIVVSGAVSKTDAPTATSMFLFINAITLYVTALDKESRVFKLKIRNNLGSKYVYYHMIKFVMMMIFMDALSRYT